MRLIYRAILKSGIRNVAKIVAFAAVWAAYTIYLTFNNVRIDPDFLGWLLQNNRFEMYINLVQLGVLGSLWYRTGENKARVRAYQFDAIRNFRRVERDYTKILEEMESVKKHSHDTAAKVDNFDTVYSSKIKVFEHYLMKSLTKK